jgi:hypothetical protein
MHPRERQHLRAIEHIMGFLRTPNGPLAIDANLYSRMEARAEANGLSYDLVLKTVESIFEQCGSDTTTAQREMISYLDNVRGSRWNPIK